MLSAPLLFLLRALALAFKAVVRAARSGCEALSDSTSDALRCAQLALLRLTPPGWLAWPWAWVIAIAQAEAARSTLPPTATRVRWLRYGAHAARLMSLAPVLHRAVGGGIRGFLFVALAVLFCDAKEDLCVEPRAVP